MPPTTRHPSPAAITATLMPAAAPRARSGRRQGLAGEMGSFLTVGVANTIVHFGLFNLLHLIVGIGPLTANGIALVAATAGSYLFNRHWTFRNRTRPGVARELPLFVLINAAAWVLSQVVILGTHYWLGLTHPVALNAALVLGVALGLVLRFGTYRQWVFPAAAAGAQTPAAMASAGGGIPVAGAESRMQEVRVPAVAMASAGGGIPVAGAESRMAEVRVPAVAMASAGGGTPVSSGRATSTGRVSGGQDTTTLPRTVTRRSSTGASAGVSTVSTDTVPGGWDTAVLPRIELPDDVTPGSDLDGAAGRGSRRGFAERLRDGIRVHRTSLILLLVVLPIVGLMHAWNMTGFPQRGDDEGTYVAQAWAVEHWGTLTHYTYWYDHPPLGWIQMALWSSVTFAYDRLPSAIAVGREFMLIAHLVSSVLLYVLARRLGIRRPFAALAVLLFGLSPLAVEFHRMVTLDNIVTPWLLASFVLALSPQKRLAAHVASGACFAIAVLTKETTLLMLPILAWQLWQSSDRTTRRYSFALSFTVFAVLASSYGLYALLKGELFPSADRVSLFGAFVWQVFLRTDGGSVFDEQCQAWRTLQFWLERDQWLVLVALCAAPITLFVRRLRVMAAILIVLALVVLRPGYLPVPYVLLFMPFAVLVIAGVADSLWGRMSMSRTSRRRGARALLTPGTAVLVVTTAVVVQFGGTQWVENTQQLLSAQPDRPYVQALDWVEAGVPRDAVLLVDDAAWVDLVHAGFHPDSVTWYFKLDHNPEVLARYPKGWRDHDYIVATSALRDVTDNDPQNLAAMENSVTVASFGSGVERVEIRRIIPDDLEPVTGGARPATDPVIRELVTTPGLELSPDAEEQLRAGIVDPRVLATLRELLADHELSVADFPSGQVRTEPTTTRLAVAIDQVDGEPVGPGSTAAAEVVQRLRVKEASLRPAEVGGPSSQGNASVANPFVYFQYDPATESLPAPPTSSLPTPPVEPLPAPPAGVRP